MDTLSSVNVAWPDKGMGDADYLHAFHKIVMPIAMEFAPELVIGARAVVLLTHGISLTIHASLRWI